MVVHLVASRAQRSPMYSSGVATDTRSAARKPAHGQFDLRVAFAAERRLLPALLLIGLVAAFASMRAGANALALAWLSSTESTRRFGF